MKEFKIEKYEHKIQIYVPYSPAFITAIKKIGGVWCSSERCWELEKDKLESAKQIVKNIYGKEINVCETVKIILEFTKPNIFKFEDDEEWLKLYGVRIINRKGLISDNISFDGEFLPKYKDGVLNVVWFKKGSKFNLELSSAKFDEIMKRAKSNDYIITKI